MKSIKIKSFIFQPKKSQSTKVSIREAIWHFPPQLHRVQRFEMWSIECEEESRAVCVKILFSGPLLRSKFTATIWIFYVFSFPVLQRCFGEMEWRKVSRKNYEKPVIWSSPSYPLSGGRHHGRVSTGNSSIKAKYLEEKAVSLLDLDFQTQYFR